MRGLPEEAAAAREVALAPGLVATAEGALWVPRRRLLAVADLHVGYEAWHAARGTAVPRIETVYLAGALESAVRRLDARRVVVCGDVLHARSPRTLASARKALRAVLAAAAPAEVVLVRGNHDRALGDVLPEAAVVDVHEEAGLAFAHGHAPFEPSAPGAWRVVGHEHPLASVRGRTGPALRMPCFLANEARRFVVLPAASPWASGVVPGRRFAGTALQDEDPRACSVVGLAEGETWSFGTLWKQ